MESTMDIVQFRKALTPLNTIKRAFRHEKRVFRHGCPGKGEMLVYLWSW